MELGNAVFLDDGLFIRRTEIYADQNRMNVVVILMIYI